MGDEESVSLLDEEYLLKIVWESHIITEEKITAREFINMLIQGEIEYIKNNKTNMVREFGKPLIIEAWDGDTPLLPKEIDECDCEFYDIKKI